MMVLLFLKIFFDLHFKVCFGFCFFVCFTVIPHILSRCLFLWLSVRVSFQSFVCFPASCPYSSLLQTASFSDCKESSFFNGNKELKTSSYILLRRHMKCYVPIVLLSFIFPFPMTFSLYPSQSNDSHSDGSAQF